MEKQLRAFLIRLPPEVRPHLGAYEPVVEAVLDRIREVLPVIRKQQREAGALVDRLLERYPPERRPEGIRRSRKLKTWAVVQEFCRRSREVVFRNPEEAVEMGRLGLEAARRLPEETPAWGDLRAFCHATLGNALRVLRRFEESSQSFERAYEYLGRSGSGDFYAQVEVFSLHASLLKDRQYFPEALAVLDQALRLLYGEGDEARRGRCLIKRACILRESGKQNAAIEAFLDALQLLDEYRDPWLTFFATQNLASLYCDLGNYTLARAALRTLSEDVIAAALGPERESNRLQLVWTRARIAAGSGQRAQALKMFDEVERGFLALPDPINAALVALDAARLHHKARDSGQVVTILKRVQEILKEQEFPAPLREMVALLIEANSEQRLLQGLEKAAQGIRELRARRPC